MKTTLSTLTSVFILSLIFLSSCKTSSDVVSNNWIQKRKYTKGYFVANKTVNKKKEVKLTSGDNVNTALEHESSSTNVNPLPLTKLKEIKNRTNLNEIERSNGKVQDKDNEEIQLEEFANSLVDDHQEMELPSEATAFKPLDAPSGMDDTEFIIIIILCIVLPPLAVFLMYDLSPQFWLSLLLTILFWLPGVIYALILALDIY